MVADRLAGLEWVHLLEASAILVGFGRPIFVAFGSVLLRGRLVLEQPVVALLFWAVVLLLGWSNIRQNFS